MGSAASKSDANAALHLCKERTRNMKQAIDARYTLSAAHLAYVQSLRNVGTSLRRFVEAEVLVDSSLSMSEPDKSPSHSSYASPSPSRFPEHVGDGSPFTPRQSNVSCMRATGSASVKVMVDSAPDHFVEEDSLTFPMPPPPPPLPDIGSSWDFFDPIDAMQAYKLPHVESASSLDLSRLVGSFQSEEENVISPMKGGEVLSQTNDELKCNTISAQGVNGNSPHLLVPGNATGKNTFVHPQSTNGRTQTEICEGEGLKFGHSEHNGSREPLARIVSSELFKSKEEKSIVVKELHAEREDASEFITHRAKNFLSSIKDIEHRFIKAAESGHEVSRMLETSKVRLGVNLEAIGKPSSSVFLSALHLVCCKKDKVSKHDGVQHMPKVINRNHSVSSRSSSSRNPLTSASKDENCESGSDFIEQFCMISGSHSSTLDRLYAWERKLYDEVKASVSIRKAYDQKCAQLRHQFARDLNAHVIDKTRAVVKDLHSQVMVIIHAVDSISKRVERLRDEELQPQLLELTQGLIRMWKAMLECHHTQHITISLAYHVKNSTAAPKGESYQQALIHLRAEMECYSSSFANWVGAYISYVESLNTWLQKCILQPRERSRGRRFAFSPRRSLAPPIFVLCRDWLAGLNSLPAKEVTDSIEGIILVLGESLEQQIEEKPVEKEQGLVLNEGESVHKEEDECGKDSNLSTLQTSLTRAFDRLTKFAESSLKLYEDVKQVTEMARTDYTDGRFRP